MEKVVNQVVTLSRALKNPIRPNPVVFVSVTRYSPAIGRGSDLWWIDSMAGPGRSMLYSLLSFAIILSLLEMYRGKLASSELLTIFGGFISSLLFLLLLTFIGNYQESSGTRTGWGAVVLAEIVALIAAATVHRVCITTCFLFSAGLLYEVNKLSGMMLSKNEPKGKRY
ncbi:Keratinocyte-associated protein 2 [Musa troglodytarum]|uniref:Keratinocyte-associated protein 2 n=1 Tax=Musa troglodytarum TaxID=320322 RepID=A0A9E7I9U8_9LILI|nr:Keratinocyte-associated protein 2 [Musa troglodytarum]